MSFEIWKIATKKCNFRILKCNFSRLKKIFRIISGNVKFCGCHAMDSQFVAITQQNVLKQFPPIDKTLVFSFSIKWESGAYWRAGNRGELLQPVIFHNHDNFGRSFRFRNPNYFVIKNSLRFPHVCFHYILIQNVFPHELWNSHFWGRRRQKSKIA